MNKKKKDMDIINREKLMKKEQLIFNMGKYVPLDKYNQAQKINVYTQSNRYGKDVPILMGNTKIGYLISKLPQHNFGSIGEYIVDTLPTSMITVKGVEKTEVIAEKTTNNGQQIISRRFLSNILSTWGYITNTTYRNAIRLWAKDIEHKLPLSHYKVITSHFKEYDYNKKELVEKPYKTYIPIEYNEVKTKTYKMLSGNEAISMLRDFLYLMRNKTVTHIIKNLNKNIISHQLYQAINNILTDDLYDKREKNLIIKAIKDKLYYTYSSVDVAWAFPKYPPEYIIGLLKEIQSRNYYSDMYVPIIYNLIKYPIKCKDTQIRPMTDIQHEKNKDDYDIGQYIWEDY